MKLVVNRFTFSHLFFSYMLIRMGTITFFLIEVLPVILCMSFSVLTLLVKFWIQINWDEEMAASYVWRKYADYLYTKWEKTYLWDMVEPYRRPKSFTPVVVTYIAAFYTGVIGAAITEQLYKVQFCLSSFLYYSVHCNCGDFSCYCQPDIVGYCVVFVDDGFKERKLAICCFCCFFLISNLLLLGLVVDFVVSFVYLKDFSVQLGI